MYVNNLEIRHVHMVIHAICDCHVYLIDDHELTYLNSIIEEFIIGNLVYNAHVLTPWPR